MKKWARGGEDADTAVENVKSGVKATKVQPATLESVKVNDTRSAKKKKDPTPQPIANESPSTEKVSKSVSTRRKTPRNKSITSDNPHRVVLSLFQQPYKSIMHAHFRLLGKERTDLVKALEREIAIKVYDMLKSRSGDAEQVQFVKLVRFGKGEEEDVDKKSALTSESECPGLNCYVIIVVGLV